MKLREVVRAIDGFKYEVWEYDVSQKGTTRTLLTLKIDQTNIRCLQHQMHHERLVKDQWFIITPDQFKSDLNHFKNNKVKLRVNGVTTTKEKVKLSLVDSILLTDHARDRMAERFGVKASGVREFLQDKLNGHFIVQNYHFYNRIYQDHTADSLVVCSKDFKTVFIMKPKGSRYVLVTCYNPLDGAYSAFSNWFNDHLDLIHTMPTLTDYFS